MNFKIEMLNYANSIKFVIKTFTPEWDKRTHENHGIIEMFSLCSLLSVEG